MVTFATQSLVATTLELGDGGAGLVYEFTFNIKNNRSDDITLSYDLCSLNLDDNIFADNFFGSQSGTCSAGETASVALISSTPTLSFDSVQVLTVQTNVGTYSIYLYFWSGSDGQYINFAEPYPNSTFSVPSGSNTSESTILQGSVVINTATSGNDGSYEPETVQLYINGGGNDGPTTAEIYLQLY